VSGLSSGSGVISVTPIILIADTDGLDSDYHLAIVKPESLTAMSSSTALVPLFYKQHSIPNISELAEIFVNDLYI
jgi:hypothetical protein